MEGSALTGLLENSLSGLALPIFPHLSFGTINIKELCKLEAFTRSTISITVFIYSINTTSSGTILDES